jgi:sugar transferase (PEP-CTERM/EpsH1 system associated)
MKILVIDEEFPFPLISGKRIRTFNLTRNLAQSSDVSYLAYGHEGSDEFNFLEDNNVTPIAVRPPDRRQSGIKFYVRLFLNLFSSYPFIVTSHFTRRFQEKLYQLVREQKYDVLICEWTPYAVFVQKIKNVKKVIVAHNIESSIWKRYEANETKALRKLYISIQRKKVENFEKACFQWADGATAVSPQEANQLSTYNIEYRPAVIDNGVDTEFFKATHNDGDHNQLVFTGAMDWRPNQDAALYFVDEILPLIKKAKPDIKVTFVGKDPSKSVMDLGTRDDVAVTGTVDDVRPFISNAAVYIVPLRIGGGSRLKILEAMAMGKAVVSTSVGAEGLYVSNDKDILLRDSPRDFADAVIELLDRPDLRHELAVNALKLVHEHYDWHSIGKRLNNYLAKVVGEL